MYPHQAERVATVLDAADLAALVATSPGNVRYVTDFVSLTHAVSGTPHFAACGRHGTALVVPSADVPTVLSDRIDVTHVVCFGDVRSALAGTTSSEARRVREIVARVAPTPADALAAALSALGVESGAVGLDESRLTPVGWRSIAERLPLCSLVPGAGSLAEARRVKGPHEIECLQRALGIAEQALDDVIQALAPGMTERAAAALFDAGVLRRGAALRPGLVAMGDSTAIPAPWPGDRGLRSGDLVRLDVGCSFLGYHASVARTAVLGTPTPRQHAVHEGLLAGIDAALDAIAPGVGVERILHGARAAARARGLTGYETDHIGQGIGLEPYELPDLRRGAETVLEIGDVLRLGLFLIEPGWGGFGVAETVLVTRAGARVLNRSARGLVVLD